MSNDLFACTTLIYLVAGAVKIYEGDVWTGAAIVGWAFSNACFLKAWGFFG